MAPKLWTTLSTFIFGVLLILIPACLADKNLTHSGCKIRPDADFVNCSGAGLESASAHIPSRTRVILLDYNQLSSLAADTLFPSSNLSHVEILSIGHNNITTVQSDSFSRLPELKELRLSNNSIVDLPSDLFITSKQLKKLNLARNPLNVEVTAEALQHLSNLNRLDLSGSLNGINNLPKLFANLTSLHELVLRDAKLSNITAAFFSPLEGLPLQQLDLARAQLGIVEEGALEPVKQIQELILVNATIDAAQLENLLSGLSNSSIQGINLDDVFVYEGQEYVLTTQTFRHMEGTKLRRLYLRGNYIGMHGKVHGKLFQTLKSLHELYLDRCDVRSVHGDAFRGLHHLKILNLSKNQISCLRGSDCRFLTSGVQLKSLHTLGLSNNLLSQEENGLIFLETTFPELAHLNLRWNRISSIPNGMFGKLDNLITLDLSDNPIRDISADALAGLTGLKKLDIENCQFLSKIRAGTFSELENLKVLNLQNSGLVHIHHAAFNHLIHLEELYLRQNKLWEDGDAIKYIKMRKSNLRVLDVGGNKLTHIPAGLLENSYKLKFLNLDSNYLSNCNELLTIPKSSLEFLDLSSNSFVQPSLECFKRFGNLKMINLAGNPFHCSCQIQDFVEWLDGPTVTLEQRPRYKCAAPDENQGKSLFSVKYTGWECYGRVALMSTMAVFAAIALTIAAIIAVCHVVCRRKLDTETGPGESRSGGITGSQIHVPNGFSHTSSRYVPLEEEDIRSTEIILNGELLDRGHRRSRREQGRDDFQTNGSREVPVVPFRRSNNSVNDGHCYNGSARSRDLSIRLIGDELENDETSITSVQDQYIKIEANMEDAV